MKQAVLVIHGIGEQRPMDTLRSFVEAMTATAQAGDKDAYWSKPDPLSRNFDLRVLKSMGRDSTDFYEYYWAHKMRGTKFGHLLAWLWDLVKRPRGDIPDALVPIWGTARWTLLLAVLLVSSGVLATTYDSLGHHRNPLALASVLLAAAAIGLQFAALSYLGDAARYLSPNPQNVYVREQIRADGVELLRALHRRGYDRIVVVGHSLGSVIAYEIVGYLWQEHHDQLAKVTGNDAALAERYARNEPLQPVIRDALPAAGKALEDGTLESVLKFREQQAAAFVEQRALGNAWRITDLVTVGSPMAHASLLLGRSTRDFMKRLARREAPACPPTRDAKGYAFGAPFPVKLGQKRFSPLYLHHAAVFAVTRWTNLYFPARFGLFGDIVGGPVAPVMGAGVLDLPVTMRKWKGWFARTWLCHTEYWSEREGDRGYLDVLTANPAAFAGRPRASATEALRWAVDLRGLRRFR